MHSPRVVPGERRKQTHLFKPTTVVLPRLRNRRASESKPISIALRSKPISILSEGITLTCLLRGTPGTPGTFEKPSGENTVKSQHWSAKIVLGKTVGKRENAKSQHRSQSKPISYLDDVVAYAGSATNHHEPRSTGSPAVTLMGGSMYSQANVRPRGRENPTTGRALPRAKQAAEKAASVSIFEEFYSLLHTLRNTWAMGMGQ